MVFDHLRRSLIKLLGYLPITSLSSGPAAASDSRGTGAGWAKLNLPNCIAAFAIELLSDTAHADSALESVTVALACKDCRKSEFTLLCYPKLVRKDDEYSGLKKGEVFERPPHEVTCSTCGKRHLLFDPDKHGYDGALGHGSPYERGRGKAVPILCEEMHYRLHVEFIYNIELAELQEIAEQENLTPQDLFDAIGIVVVASDGRMLKSFDYECA